MMKKSNFIYIGLAMVAGLTFSSCKDFLEEDPRSFLSPENFYNTPSQATAAIIGVYDVMDNVNMHGQLGMIVIGDGAADNVIGSVMVDKGTNPISYEIDPGNTNILDHYESSYQLINRANAVIDRLAESSVDADLTAKITAEAKFLRAYTYFNLVRTFGGIVLQLSESATLNELEQPRASEEEVYTQIIADLTEAANVLPDEPLGTGRADQWAAKGLLAKVYLTWGNYDQAAALTGEIINSDKFSLLPEYNKLFRPENTDLTEEILFAVQYGPLRRSNLTNFLTPAETSAYGSIRPMDDLYTMNIYETGDLRKDYTLYDSIIWKGSWLTPANGPYFLKFAEDYLIDLVAEGQSGTMDYPVLRYADVLLMHAEALNEINNGPTNPAYDAINEVRDRANLIALSGLNYEEFKMALLHERRVELVLEGHRWFDLKRFGMLEEVMQVYDGWNPNYALFPIPETAFTSNSKLIQNDGY